jgi:Family of unknown function (DUF5706)
MSDDGGWQGKAATDQLNRVLGFFARIENKSSALFAINTGMAALFGVHLQWANLAVWYIAIPGIATVGLIAASLLYLYFAANPQLNGGARSIVYFREIAARTEADYLKEMKACSAENYTDQLLAQVWRNSEILSQKFDYVRRAFICTAAGVLPWAFTLLAAGFQNAR